VHGQQAGSSRRWALARRRLQRVWAAHAKAVRHRPGAGVVGGPQRTGDGDEGSAAGPTSHHDGDHADAADYNAVAAATASSPLPLSEDAVAELHDLAVAAAAALATTNLSAGYATGLVRVISGASAAAGAGGGGGTQAAVNGGQLTQPLRSVAYYDVPGVESSGTAAPGNSSAPPLPPSAPPGAADGGVGGIALCEGHLHNAYTATVGNTVAQAVGSGAHDVVDAGDGAAADARGSTAAAARGSRSGAAAASGVSRSMPGDTAVTDSGVAPVVRPLLGTLVGVNSAEEPKVRPRPWTRSLAASRRPFVGRMAPPESSGVAVVIYHDKEALVVAAPGASAVKARPVAAVAAARPSTRSSAAAAAAVGLPTRRTTRGSRAANAAANEELAGTSGTRGERGSKTAAIRRVASTDAVTRLSGAAAGQHSHATGPAATPLRASADRPGRSHRPPDAQQPRAVRGTETDAAHGGGGARRGLRSGDEPAESALEARERARMRAGRKRWFTEERGSRRTRRGSRGVGAAPVAATHGDGSTGEADGACTRGSGRHRLVLDCDARRRLHWRFAVG